MSNRSKATAYSGMGSWRGVKTASLCIGRLPRTRGIALYQTNGDVRVLAWFKDEEAAQIAKAWLDRFCSEDGYDVPVLPAVSK